MREWLSWWSVVIYDLCLREHERNARVAQLVERDLAKVEAAGSSPVSRFYFFKKSHDLLFMTFFITKKQRHLLLPA